MKLDEFFNSLDIKSDKGTFHDYINGYYSSEFSNKKNDKIKILEIGVGQAHSMYLWKNYFTNGKIIGLEYDSNLIQHFINDESKNWVDNNKSNVIIKICDAYSDDSVNSFLDGEFDYIIDDGPHSITTQLLFIEKYINKIKSNGKLIIEDIQTESDMNILINKAVDMNLNYKSFDLRLNKNRYDDLLLEITKKIK